MIAVEVRPWAQHFLEAQEHAGHVPLSPGEDGGGAERAAPLLVGAPVCLVRPPLPASVAPSDILWDPPESEESHLPQESHSC